MSHDQTPSPWTLSSKQLPPVNQPVLVAFRLEADGEESTHFVSGSWNGKRWADTDTNFTVHGVFAWSPLPTLPAGF